MWHCGHDRIFYVLEYKGAYLNPKTTNHHRHINASPADSNITNTAGHESRAKQ